jgi:ADP-ribose pyrophosphatase YjhB (NUDIX family)
MEQPPKQRPTVATISAVTDGDVVLLVRRANPPDAGLWGFPGGKIDYGEPIHEAAIRELRQETNVRAQPLTTFTAVDVFERDADGALRSHYVLVAVLCRYRSGTPMPASDALEARWLSLDDIERTDLATSARVAEVARQAVTAFGRRFQ